MYAPEWSSCRIPRRPLSRALLAVSDLGLVSLAPGVIRFAYPSKMATYLGAGVPVLVGVEPDSAMARIVVDSGAGAVLPTQDCGAARARAPRPPRPS